MMNVGTANTGRAVIANGGPEGEGIEFRRTTHLHRR